MGASARVLNLLRLASELTSEEREEFVVALTGDTGDALELEHDEEWQAELSRRADRVIHGHSKGKPLTDDELAQLFGLGLAPPG